MKTGWQTKSLADVLLKTETVNPNLQPESDFEYIDVSSVSNQTFQIEETQNLKGKDAPSRARKLVKTNDILFATIRPTLQRIAIVPSKLNNQVCSTGYFVLRPNQSIHYKYLYYYLFADGFMGQMEALQKGASYPAVTDNEVKSQSISFPLIPEQQRIVAILDQAFEGVAKARANAEQNLQNARALFESHLLSVFMQRGIGWVLTTIGAVCNKVEYGTSAKSKEQGKTPVLRMGNIQNRRFDWDKLVYTDDDSEIEKYLLKHNDVLFNRTNSPELVGKTAIYKSESPAIFAGYLIRIHRKEDLINADYLNYFLNSQIAMDYGKTVAISSVNQANINGKKLKDYPIPVPSLSEQEAIVMKMDALEIETQRLEALYQRKIECLDELKKSLLQQAFSGEL